jgi:hypothetical protein
VSTRFDEAVCHRHGVDEAAADGLHIHGRRAIGDAQLALDHTGGAGEATQVIRGGGGHDQVDVIGLHARRFQGALRRLQGEVAGELVRFGIVARGDAAARDDPFVRGLDALLGQLRGQLMVGDALGRQVAAGADDFAVSGHAVFLLC